MNELKQCNQWCVLMCVSTDLSPFCPNRPPPHESQKLKRGINPIKKKNKQKKTAKDKDPIRLRFVWICPICSLKLMHSYLTLDLSCRQKTVPVNRHTSTNRNRLGPDIVPASFSNCSIRTVSTPSKVHKSPSIPFKDCHSFENSHGVLDQHP